MMRVSRWLDPWPVAHTPADAHDACVLLHTYQLMLMMRLPWLLNNLLTAAYTPADAHDAGFLWLEDWPSATYIPADAHSAQVSVTRLLAVYCLHLS